MDKIKALLEKIKKPKIKKDMEEYIEQEVGDSVADAYLYGVSDGKDIGRYKLAQELLNMLAE